MRPRPPRLTTCSSRAAGTDGARSDLHDLVALVGVTSRPLRADSHGKRAPEWPPWRAASMAGRQPPQAVFEHGSGRRRMGRREEGKDEDVGVPEHVAPVTGPASVPGHQRRLRRCRPPIPSDGTTGSEWPPVTHRHLPPRRQRLPTSWPIPGDAGRAADRSRCC